MVIENQAMRADLDVMHQEIEQAFKESAEENKSVVYMTSGVSASLAAGAVSYLLRAGSLMSSFLATVPIWKGFDPVAVLLVPKRIKLKDKNNLQQDVDKLDTKSDQKAENMFSGIEDQ